MKEISFIRTQTPDINRVHKSAFESIVIISATIFLCEILVMAIIYILPIRFPWIESFWDATLLLILLSPVVYFYIYNPSHQALQERIEYQKKLRELTTELLSAQEQERKKLAAELHDPGSAALRKGLYPR